MVTTTDRKYQPQELTTIVEGTCYRSFKPFHLTTTITNQQSLSYPAINVRKQSGTHGQCYGVTDRTVVLRNSDPSSAAQQPDIDWIPNYQKYRARCLQRLKRGGLEPELPIGYPQKVDSRLVWSGQELRHKENEYIIKLSMEEIDEIEEAVSCFSCKFRLY